jgi:hypothetical protein
VIHDKVLRGILLAAERGLSIGITLYIPGMIVSGLVISRKQWVEAFTQNFASSAQSCGLDEAVVLRWAVERQVETSTADELPDDAVIKIVHLKDARVYFNPKVEFIGSPFWRGNVASITGWHFGQLVTSASAPST